MFGAEIWYEKVEGHSPPHFSRIDSVQGDNGQELKYERKEFEGGMKEDILWSGTGRNGVQNGSYDADKNGNQVAYHRFVDDAGKQTLIGQNGLFTSGFIGDRDFMPPKGNERKDWLYSTDISEGKDKNTLIIKPYRDMTDLGMGDGDDWIMGEYNRSSVKGTNKDSHIFRISEMEGPPVEPRKDGVFPSAYIRSIDNPVHGRNVDHPELWKYSDHKPGNPKEIHKNGHSGIDASTETRDIFASKTGRIKMDSNELHYNGINVQFQEGGYQKTYHASGNASYIFPGQVVRAGEYLARRGAIGVTDDHLHQEYYNPNSSDPLNTRQILQAYAPKVNKDGERWECRGDFCNY